MLLLYLEEEDAFFLLCAIVEDILPGYYTKSMVGSLVDVQVFDELVKKYQPKIHAKITHCGTISSIAIPWFMCLFINNLPWKETLLAIDLVLTEGSRMLFVIGLAIFHACKDEIFSCSEESTFDVIRNRLKNILEPKALRGYIKYYRSLIVESEIIDLRLIHEPIITEDIVSYGQEFDCTEQSSSEQEEASEFELFEQRMKYNQELMNSVSLRARSFDKLFSAAMESHSKQLTVRGRRSSDRSLGSPRLPSFRTLLTRDSNNDPGTSPSLSPRFAESPVRGMKDFLSPRDCK